MPNLPCPNCSQPLADGSAFCSHCGQRTLSISRPWLEVTGDLVDELFDLDGKMLRSAKMLLTKPGLLAREYSAGRRASYTSPVRMYLVISVVFFFLLPVIQAPAASESMGKSISSDQYSRAMFALLPVFAGLLKLLYRQAYYLTHLVFSAYLFSFFFILMAGLMATEALADQYVAFAVVQVLMLLWALTYLAISLRVSYAQPWPKTVIKAAALVLAFMPMLAVSIAFSAQLTA